MSPLSSVLFDFG